jgi:hypothetical protein
MKLSQRAAVLWQRSSLRLVARLQDGLQGLPLPTITPLISTPGLTLVFLAVALWRFSREEF